MLHDVEVGLLVCMCVCKQCILHSSLNSLKTGKAAFPAELTFEVKRE